MTRLAVTAVLLLFAPTDLFAQDPPPKPWYERIRFGGDFRSRYEGFYGQDAETRNRVRFRLRLRADTEITRDFDLHLQLASGDPGTPVSTNQTFTEFFTPKPISIDRAYLAFTPASVPPLTLGLGKFPHAFSYTQMLMDDDLNFEGAWEKMAWAPRDGTEITVGSLQTVVSERSAAADSYMVAGFGAVGVERGRHEFQLSAANYAWGNPDRIALGNADGALDSILTNTLVRNAAGSVLRFESRFNVVELIAEARLATPRESYPLRLLAQFARNTRAANERDSGFWVEAEYGSPRAPRSWGATYTYGWIEQDLTPSAFVFSDMPGTNTRLHMIETSYVAASGVSLDTTLHLTKPLVAAAGASSDWLTRLHLGVVVRF